MNAFTLTVDGYQFLSRLKALNFSVSRIDSRENREITKIAKRATARPRDGTARPAYRPALPLRGAVLGYEA